MYNWWERAAAAHEAAACVCDAARSTPCVCRRLSKHLQGKIIRALCCAVCRGVHVKLRVYAHDMLFSITAGCWQSFSFCLRLSTFCYAAYMRAQLWLHGQLCIVEGCLLFQLLQPFGKASICRGCRQKNCHSFVDMPPKQLKGWSFKNRLLALCKFFGKGLTNSWDLQGTHLAYYVHCVWCLEHVWKYLQKVHLWFLNPSIMAMTSVLKPWESEEYENIMSTLNIHPR